MFRKVYIIGHFHDLIEIVHTLLVYITLFLTETKSTVTVGRFQVSPSKAIPTPATHTDSEKTPSEASTIIRSLDQPSSSFVAYEQNPSPRENIENLSTSGETCDSSSSVKQPETQSNQNEDQGEKINQEQNEEDNDEIPLDKKQRRKKVRRVDCGTGLLGTSVDSGFSVALDPDGRAWDGNTGSPPYPSPLHNLWMSYTRSSSYLSSDESESEDDEMWGELQDLREK